MHFVGVLSLLGSIALFSPLLSATKATVSNVPLDPETQREVQCDLPRSQHLRNLPDGGGCCVFASIDMMSRWHNFHPMIGVLQDRLGGGWPQLVTKTFQRRAPGFTGYVQAEGSQTEQVIDWAMRTNRIVCVTYGYGERYQGSFNPSGQISHMVIFLHMDPENTPNARACVLDNNFPGTYEWMPRAEALRRHRLKGAWAIALLLPPPPPIPTN